MWGSFKLAGVGYTTNVHDANSICRHFVEHTVLIEA